MTKHGSAAFALASKAGAVGRGTHRVEVRWVRDGRVVARSARTVR